MAWQGVFRESWYSSAINLRVENDRLTGEHAPPTTSQSGLGGADTSAAATLGHARVNGSVAAAPGGRGTWLHVNGEYRDSDGGTFDMLSNGATLGSGFAGHWRLADQEELHAWAWGAEPASDDSAEAAAAVVAAGPCLRGARRFVNGVGMERFGVACAWLFLILTVLQLASKHLRWSINTRMNLACNVVYMVLYGPFLVAWAFMAVRPSRLYMAGEGLYLAGYAVFAALYAGEAAPEVARALYHAGSWLFVVGSLCLLPPVLPAATSGGKCGVQHFSPLARGAALWWGATAFLAGSCVFAADATRAASSRETVVLGLGLFVLGRLFFLRGSQTPRCSVVFAAVRPSEESADRRRPNTLTTNTINTTYHCNHQYHQHHLPL